MTDPAIHQLAVDAVPRAVVDHIVAAAAEAIAARGRFRIALAGGSTPRPTYRALVDAAIDWPSVDVLFGDERCVSPDDPASNYRMAADALLDHLTPGPAVHRIEGERGGEAAAAAYEPIVAGGGVDLALLGIGTDGHTASLFPGGPELAERARLVVATRSPAPPPARVSLSLPALRAARQVVFIVTGAAKAGPLARVVAELRGSHTPTLPAAMVRPTSGRLAIYADAAACAELGAKEST